MAGGQSIPAKMLEKHDSILSLIEPFCRTYLNEEYLMLCQRLLGTLARKRPSPLVNGTAAAWGCGIVRTIGRINFLDDRTRTPHMKMADINGAFGLSAGSAQTRSKAITDMLKYPQFDPHWTLPSRMDKNPVAWLVQVNGIILDARYMPKELQQQAFDRGIIPYLPKDPDGNANDAED